MADFSDKFIPTESTGARFGQSIGQALEGFAQHKMQQLQQNRQAQDLASLLGIPLHEAQAASRLGLNKDKFLEHFWRRGGGMQQPGQEGNVTGNVFRNQPTNQAGRVQQVLTPAQEKGLPAIREQFDDLIDLNTTSKKMLADIKSGKQINVGALSNLKSQWDPTLLNKDTELFDKDSNHILNLSGKKIKGVRGKYVVQTLEKEKPGIKHSIPVNTEILERYIKESDHRIKSMQKDFPYYDLQFEAQEAGEQDEIRLAQEDPISYPQFYEEGTRIEQDGVEYVLQNGEWQEV